MPSRSSAPDPTTEGLLLVTAARETGLLGALDGELSADQLALRLKLEPRATAACLEALIELGVAERHGAGFRLTRFGRARFVDEGDARFVGGGLALWRAALRDWLFLDAVLRGGVPLPEDRSLEARERLYDALDAKPAQRSAALVERVLARAGAGATRALDVGGGSGRHARELLARGIQVTLAERADVVDFVRRRYALEALANLELVAVDARERLPPGPFDIVVLAEVLHELGPDEAAAVVRHAAGSSAPAGVVAVVEPLLERSRGAALRGVAIALHTPGGRTYAEGEIGAWLTKAGFGGIEVEDLDAELALITAVRT